MNGIAVCRELREAQIDTPVLMLSARSLVEQRVEGLDAGGRRLSDQTFRRR
jgi:two-component system response regulator MprA